MTIKLGVIVLAGPGHGGTYQYTLAMLQALRHTTGFNITLYGDPQNADFAESGFPISRFSESRAQQFAALAAHRLRIKLSDPFVAEDLLLAPIYSLALLHTSKPFVYTLHDLQERYYPDNFSRRQREWRDRVHRALLGRAARVICESNYVKTDIKRFFGVTDDRARVMPQPPRRQFLAPPGEAQLGEVRARLGLPDTFLFYPAQFWVHKNHLRLVEAFRIVADERPDLHLVLTGKTRDQYQTVMGAIARFGLGARVRHLGHVEHNDLPAIYQLATALVMPSLFESVSIPIYEAFWAGTPVIASNVLAIPEQVGDAGLLFDPTSVSSIADSILRTIRDPGAARQRAQRGRDRMRAMAPERYAEQLQRLLSELK